MSISIPASFDIFDIFGMTKSILEMGFCMFKKYLVKVDECHVERGRGKCTPEGRETF